MHNASWIGAARGLLGNIGKIFTFMLTSQLVQAQPLLPTETRCPSPSCMTFSPSGKSFAFGCEGGVSLYECATGNLRAFLPHTTILPIDCILSPDGSLLAVQGQSEILIWDLQKETVRTTLHASAPGAFSRDGKKLYYRLDPRPGSGGGFEYNVGVWDIVADKKCEPIMGFKYQPFQHESSASSRRRAVE
jgi:WD40 repeat protein